MSREFNGTSDVLYSTTVATTVVNNFSVFLWVNSTNSTGEQVWLSNGHDNHPSTSSGWSIENDAGVFKLLYNGVLRYSTGVSVTNGTWEHFGVVRNAGTSQGYKNGATAGGTTTAAPSTPSTVITIGAQATNATPTLKRWSAAKLAEAGIWDVPLTAGEIQSLSKGISPLLVRPQNLVFYCPIVGRNSPEIELKKSNNLTLVGTSNSAHPRVIYPFGSEIRSFITPPSAPTVALNTPADVATGVSTTPNLLFTGTDANSNEIEYNLQVDTVNTFDSQASTIALVQTKKGNAGSYSNTNVQAFDSNVTAGNLIVLFIAAGAANTIASIADTLTNTYTLIDTAVGTDRATWMYYAKNIAGGANTITVTYTSGRFPDSIVIAREYSGLDTVTPFDQTAKGNSGVSYVNSHTTAASSNTTQANELVVVGVGSGGSTSPLFTAGSGYGNNTTQDGFDLYTYAAMEDKTISATGAQTGAFDSTGYVRSATIVATFKAKLSPLLNKLSVTPDATFTGTGDPHPWPSGNQVTYTVQAGDILTASTTYYWKVAGIDPLGGNTYGAWSTTRSFTTAAGGGTPSISTMLMMGV